MGQSYALRSVVDYAQSTSTVIPGRLRGEVGQSFYFILLREVGQPFYLRGEKWVIYTLNVGKAVKWSTDVRKWANRALWFLPILGQLSTLDSMIIEMGK